MSTVRRRRPRQLRSRETVAVILEAAAQMFDREGLATTTNRIAERAGVSIGSLYQYFPDKQALLYALAERHVRQARTRLDEVFARLRAEQPPFEDTVRAVVDEVVALHSTQPGLHRLMHRLAPRRAAELAVLQDFEDRITDEFAYHLVRCGRGGADPTATARMAVTAVDAYLHRVQTRQVPDSAQLLAFVDRLLAD